VPAGGRAGVETGRGPATYGHGGRAGRPGHRRVAGRGSGEDGVLERVQAARSMVGRATALLIVVTALAVYDVVHAHLWDASDWWDVAFIAVVLIPLTFAVVWLVLPLRRARGLLPAGLSLAVLAAVLH